MGDATLTVSVGERHVVNFESARDGADALFPACDGTISTQARAAAHANARWKLCMVSCFPFSLMVAMGACAGG